MRVVTIQTRFLLAMLKILVAIALIISLLLVFLIPGLDEIAKQLTQLLVALLSLNLGLTEARFYWQQVRIARGE